MSESLKTFMLVDSNYNGKKCSVLEMGTEKCDLLNQFLIHGYTDLTAINKSNVNLYSSFYCYKVEKKEVSIFDSKTLILHDRDNVKINTTDKSKYINETMFYYATELNLYYDSIDLYSYSEGDFFSFNETNKFNIILSRYVFHLYPPDCDVNIIRKLTELTNKNGLIYIKVYNSENIHTICTPDKKKVNEYYYFTDERLNKYKEIFEVKSEQILDENTELLLKKK